MDKKTMTMLMMAAATACACTSDDMPGSFEPSLSVGEATGVMHTEATLHGAVGLRGNTAMPRLNFTLATGGGADSIISDITLDGNEASRRITGLTPGTTYRYRLQATNGRVTLTSSTMSFTTVPSSVPAVGEATDITRTEATLHGQASPLDNGSLPELEFLIGTGGKMEAARQPLTLGADNVTTRLDSLTPGTAYSYCLKAFDGHNNTYSDTMTFVTLPNNKPSVTQPKLYSQGPTSMIASYSVTDNGGEPITATGFCVTNTATGAQRRIEADADINADTTFTLHISGLQQNTEYEIRAYAANTVGESQGPALEITTGNAVTLTVAGSLEYTLGEDIYSFTTLSIKGPLNGDDLKCLRKMLGIGADGKPTRGQLARLNMAEAHIVEGGGAYDNSHFTRNGVVGQGLFAHCTGLVELKLPDDATVIEKDALKGCTGLKQLQIPSATTDVTPSDGCTALSAITVLPNNRAYTAADGVLLSADGSQIVWFPMGKTGDYALPATVTSIGDYAFQGCSITRFTLPDGLKEIGQAAFFGSMVEEVTMPDKLRLIPTATFQQCSRLRILRLGSMTELISDYAFDGCPLQHIYLDAQYPPVCNDKAFATSYAELLQSCTLHVPAGRSGFYKADRNWGKFKHITEK